jgi:hypothetical protein
MFLALGPTIRQGHTAAATERGLHDIAPTIGWLMGIALPHAVDGTVMAELLNVDPGETPKVMPDETLDVGVLTTNGFGEPCSAFAAGDFVGVELTVCNSGPSAACVYQAVVMTDRCHRGGTALEEAVWLAPGECFTAVEHVTLPEYAPAGDWPLAVEVRAIDEDGSVVRGFAEIQIAVEAAEPAAR